MRASRWGCGPSGSDPPAPTPARPSPTATGAPPAGGPIRLVQVGSFDQPLALASRQGDQSVCVAEKGGRKWAVRDARVEPVLDLSGEVSHDIEQGLLGLAFAPSGRHIYVSYTDGSCAVTGGVVYRGQRSPSLQGRYVYGDFCPGLLRALSVQGNGEVYATSLGTGGLYRIDA